MGLRDRKGKSILPSLLSKPVGGDSMNTIDLGKCANRVAKHSHMLESLRIVSGIQVMERNIHRTVKSSRQDSTADNRPGIVCVHLLRGLPRMSDNCNVSIEAVGYETINIDVGWKRPKGQRYSCFTSPLLVLPRSSATWGFVPPKAKLQRRRLR